MVFWIAVLIGLLLLYLATRIGFFETVVLAFNILTSVYVGIYSAPTSGYEFTGWSGAVELSPVSCLFSSSSSSPLTLTLLVNVLNNLRSSQEIKN